MLTKFERLVVNVTNNEVSEDVVTKTLSEIQDEVKVVAKSHQLIPSENLIIESE